MRDDQEEIDNVLVALADHLAKQGTQPSKSKKKRERLRLKKLQKKVDELEANNGGAQQEVVAVEEKPFPFLDLPAEIRIMIYNILYARPVCIVPGVTHYKHRPHYNRQDQGNTKYSVYRYAWAGLNQILPLDSHWHDNFPPSRDGSLQPIEIKWKTNDLTEEEKKLVMTNQELPVTEINDEYRTNIVNEGYVDPNGKPWIRREQVVMIAGFYGIKLLRTCKQINEEGAAVLYGSNIFDFRTYCGRLVSHEDLADHVPNWSNSERVAPSTDVVLRDVNRMFEKIRQPEFIWKNHMLRFFHTIGPRNTALLKSIKLWGPFKDREVFRCRCHGREICPKGLPKHLNMQEHLPIYSSVLKNACNSLETFYLDGIVKIRPELLRYNDEGEEEKEFKLRTCHQALELSVGNFVQDLLSLPKFRKFHLGWSGNMHGQGELTWTSSEWEKQLKKWGYGALKWVDIVDERFGPSAVGQEIAYEGLHDPSDMNEAEFDEPPMPKGMIKTRDVRGCLTSAVDSTLFDNLI